MASFEEFKALHESQLVASVVPEHLWPALCQKLASETFDSGDYFQLIKEEADDVSSWQVISTQTLPATDPNAIFLVDHAWTFRVGEARQYLYSMPGLIDRMSSLMEVDDCKEPTPEITRKSSMCGPMLNREILTEAILRSMWKFVQTYSIKAPGSTTEEQMPVWYVMDEFGSRIGHSETPSARVVPFYYAPTQTSFSILFLVRDLDDGEEVTRNYVEPSPIRRKDWNEFYMLPWFDQDFSHLPKTHIEHANDYFMQNRSPDSIPDVLRPTSSTAGCRLKIYAENDQIVKHIKHKAFEITNNREEADVLWLREHFHDYKRLAEEQPDSLVNQFPYENVLTVKDLFAAVVQSVDAESPTWMPITYNLNTELPQFVACFQDRQKRGQDNHWIIKPWNLARALDTHVSNDLSQIIRIIDSGPKIASKYIEDPVLFRRQDTKAYVKFDLRYIVVLRGAQPLELLLYKKFWLRFAIKPFVLESLDSYETHFTVFNYSAEDKILQMECSDFIKQFEKQYPTEKWAAVQEKVNLMLKQVFDTVTHFTPPKGIAPNPQSRAMYGVDAMLRWADGNDGNKSMEPVFLEANFLPDCERACEYYPDFADVMFETMFLDNDMVSEAAKSQVSLL